MENKVRRMLLRAQTALEYETILKESEGRRDCLILAFPVLRR